MSISRRFFLTAAAASATSLLPILADARTLRRGRYTDKKLRVVSIGCGGMGGGDLASISSHPDVAVAAVCDVDNRTLESQTKKYSCKGFRDYRELFRTFTDFDAAIVSTPDHSHALPAMLAMLAGKHVYCQKPLTHNAMESRALALTSIAMKVTTQMGTQRAATAGKRQALKLVAAGEIGAIKAVHGWSDRPTAGYPFGHGANRPLGADAVPEWLDWNMWLGAAPWRPYKKDIYAPFHWRAWRDFGTGAVGDMGCHILDTAFFACELTQLQNIKGACKESTAEQCPTSQRVDMRFPKTSRTAGDLTLSWYDGQWPMDFAVMNIHPDEGNKIPANTVILVGESGTLVVNMDGELRLFKGGGPAKIPKEEFTPLDHYHQWVDACLGRTTTRSPFSFGGNLTEALCLAAIASQFPDVDLQWDAKQMRFTNNPGATTFVSRPPRTGYELPQVPRS